MLSKEQTISTVKKIISEFPDTYTRRIKMKGNEDLVASINNYLPTIINTDKYSFKTKIYWLINNITAFPKCIVCKKELSDKNIKNIFIGYHECCSQKCAKNSKQRKERYKQSCIRHFGVENASQSETIKKKKKNTVLQNYGVDNPAKAHEVKDKIKETNLKRYGFKCTFQNEDVYLKAKHTTVKHFGVEHPMQCRELRMKAQQKYNYFNVHFDSKPELALYIWLKDSNKRFEYQPDMQFKYICNGKEFVYFPDFKVEDQVLEVKGKHFFKEDGTMQNPWCHSQDEIYEAKHQCMLRNNVKIVLDDDVLILNAIAHVNSKYGKNYLDQFKRTCNK